MMSKDRIACKITGANIAWAILRFFGILADIFLSVNFIAAVSLRCGKS